jgi:prepilin peptidase CpaA
MIQSPIGLSYLVLKIDLFSFILVVFILFTAVIMDLRWQKIPNWLTFPAMTSGVVYSIILYGLKGLLFSILGLILGMGFFLIPYLIGGMGAGDVKLMGALGTFLGAENVFWACIFSFVFGGFYGICHLIYKRKTKSYLRRYGVMVKTFFSTGNLSYLSPSIEEKSQKISYGVAIAGGTILSIFWKSGII